MSIGCRGGGGEAFYDIILYIETRFYVATFITPLQMQILLVKETSSFKCDSRVSLVWTTSWMNANLVEFVVVHE